MKKNEIKLVIERPFIVFLFSLFLFLPFTVQASDKDQFYYGFDEKIVIDKVDNKILVKIKPTQSRSDGEQLVKNSFEKTKKIEWKRNDLCEIELYDSKEGISDLLFDDNIISAREIYKTTEGLEFGHTDEIVVRFKEGIDDADKEKLQISFDLKKSKETNIYEIYTIHKERDILDVANTLYETGYFEFAYPNIICKAEFNSVYPNDPYFQYQITCHNTGQMFNGHTGTPDADIDAPEAWGVTQGNSNNSGCF